MLVEKYVNDRLNTTTVRKTTLPGMRRGEILSLRWEHVNLTGRVQTFVDKGETWNVKPGWLLIERSKNGRPRAIPMSGRVRDMMAGLYDDETHGEFVFLHLRSSSSGSTTGIILTFSAIAC